MGSLMPLRPRRSRSRLRESSASPFARRRTRGARDRGLRLRLRLGSRSASASAPASRQVLPRSLRPATIRSAVAQGLEACSSARVSRLAGVVLASGGGSGLGVVVVGGAFTVGARAIGVAGAGSGAGSGPGAAVPLGDWTAMRAATAMRVAPPRMAYGRASPHEPVHARRPTTALRGSLPDLVDHELP